jgi:RNA polymerase sigma factor (sigma-70 family)
MSSPGSVTEWISRLKAGEAAAAQPLWERYFRRLVALARHKLQGTPRRAADEEDAAQSAFASFFRAAQQGRFPRLTDRDELWPLLVVLTLRKALRLARAERRRKRGGGTVANETALPNAADDEPAFDQLLSREPTPEFAAQESEECRRLLHRLGDADLRAVALLKMEGYTVEETAAQLGCVPRTVRRKLRLIRDLWATEMEP